MAVDLARSLCCMARLSEQECSCLAFPGVGGVGAGLGFAIGVEEEVVVRDSLFNKLRDEEKLGAVDDRMDALLERLHGGGCLEGVREQDDGSMAALAHGHLLEGLQREVFSDAIGGEELLDDNYLVANLAEPDEEVSVRSGGVDFVAEFAEGGLGGFQPFGCGKGQQGR